MEIIQGSRLLMRPEDLLKKPLNVEELGVRWLSTVLIHKNDYSFITDINIGMFPVSSLIH